MKSFIKYSTIQSYCCWNRTKRTQILCNAVVILFGGHGKKKTLDSLSKYLLNKKKTNTTKNANSKNKRKRKQALRMSLNNNIMYQLYRLNYPNVSRNYFGPSMVNDRSQNKYYKNNK